MKCPGQDPRYWKFDAIFDVQCPNCDTLVEFFKDETRRKCRNCGQHVLNPKMDFGCAAHCKFAEQCFGDLSPELIKEKEELFKDRVAVAMKLHFKTDFKRIAHAAKVARYAERIVDEEHGDPAVVMTAAYLHDVALKGAEKQCKTEDCPDREDEGIRAVQEILLGLGAAEPFITEVCDIIGSRLRPRADETINFKVVYDSDLTANLEAAQKKYPIDLDKLTDLIESRFLTRTGRAVAREVLLGVIDGDGTPDTSSKSQICGNSQK